MRMLLILMITISVLCGQEEPAVLRVTLKDGSVLIGRFVSETPEVLILESKYGGQITIPLTDIVDRENLMAAVDGTGEMWPHDRNYSRYLWTPTAFALKVHQGYCTNGCLFFPSIAWGITDQVSVNAGMTLFPGVKFGDQIKYLAVKYTIFEQQRFATAAGLQYFTLGFGEYIDLGFGIVFGTATIGDHNNHFSGSMGYGFAKVDFGEDGDASGFEWMDRPLFTFSGVRRTSRYLALITENWIFPGMEINDVLFSLGVRFLGERLSVNFAGVFNYELLEDGGIPFPWLDFSFHLGQ